MRLGWTICALLLIFGALAVLVSAFVNGML
jgi:hypothetical protein